MADLASDPVVVLTGLAAAAAAGLLLWLAFGHPPPDKGWNADNQLEVVRLALFVVGGIGGVVAYRKQRVAETADRRADAANARENSKLFNDRFMAACAGLGNSAAAVRLAAVYAVARLADDWVSERQTAASRACSRRGLLSAGDRGTCGLAAGGEMRELCIKGWPLRPDARHPVEVP